MDVLFWNMYTIPCIMCAIVYFISACNYLLWIYFYLLSNSSQHLYAKYFPETLDKTFFILAIWRFYKLESVIKMGLTIQSISSCVFGIVIGFLYSWKLALVLSSLFPLLFFIGFIDGKVLKSHSSNEQTAYAAAAVIAEEVITSIKTVVAFGGEPYEINR